MKAFSRLIFGSSAASGKNTTVSSTGQKLGKLLERPES
jgi:hypothetical protein